MALSPKNWDSFQHYKDRKPSWIKLHKTLLDDFEFSRLPVASKALAPMLWLLASEYKDGNITASFEAICFRLHMSLKDFGSALKPLLESGFFILDDHDSNSLAEPEQSDSLEKEIQVKKEKESCAVSPHLEECFEEFWKKKPKRKGANPKASARKSYFAAVKSGVDPPEINAAAEKWARDDGDKAGTEFIPMAVTWLNQKRFEDYKTEPISAASLEFMRRKGYELRDGQWFKTMEGAADGSS